jgi:hypothetical protein
MDISTIFDKASKHTWSTGFDDFYKWWTDKELTADTPKHELNYLGTKFDTMKGNFWKFWGELDQDNKKKFLKWVYMKY